MVAKVQDALRKVLAMTSETDSNKYPHISLDLPIDRVNTHKEEEKIS